MFFYQIVRQDIGCAAYIVGSTDAGEAAVIDPRIDMVDEIVGIAGREALRIRYVIETHNHADHVAGHHQLARRTGATIAVHEAAGVAYPHRALRDGEELALGEVRLRVLHTPGHRPEHIAIAAIDTTRGDEPWLVVTGDSLFIGDVARPDLAIDGREGATALFDSLHRQLLRLPEGTMVYPGHVSGSLCGRVTNRMTGTTIGFERRHNPALAITDEARFVAFMNESLPERPPNMARIVDLNRSAVPLDVSAPMPLEPDGVARRQADGAIVLDVREPGEFAAGHVPGARSVALARGQFQNRVGLIVPPDAEIVLVASTDEEAMAAADALSVIGLDKVTGYLAGGMARWQAAGRDYATLPEITVRELQARRAELPDLRILDVREPGEWADYHIEGALNVPFYRVERRAAELADGRPIAVICGGGVRSTIATSILQAAGVPAPLNVAGGMDAWTAAGLPVVRPGVLTAAD